MVHNKYVFDPYPLQVTMQRLAENLKARRLEKKLSTKSLSEMSGVPASSYGGSQRRDTRIEQIRKRLISLVV